MNRIKKISGSARFSCASDGGAPSEHCATRVGSSRDGAPGAVDLASTAAREARAFPCAGCRKCSAAMFTNLVKP